MIRVLLGTMLAAGFIVLLGLIGLAAAAPAR